MSTLCDFDYQLPPGKIAQTPVEPRDASKLLVIDRKTRQMQDKHFFDLSDLLTPNDVLVINNTKVFPARLTVQRTVGGPTQQAKSFEILLEREIAVTRETITWSALTKPGLKVGDKFIIPNSHVMGVCTKINGYTREILFHINREQFFVLLDNWAKTPIPPYIKWATSDERSLRERYQTVFAKQRGAVAAPTAGLHFTPELLSKLKTKGVQIEEVTLHVGLGTFLPVRTDDIAAHHMHSEWFELTQPTASRLREAKVQGKRIIAVGTTVVRVLETTGLQSQVGTTDIFIYPPYQFACVDQIITNFHTPKSTLLMLVSAFCSEPNTKEKFVSFNTSLVGRAYNHALENSYRFYSFGDAMWIR